MEHQFSKELQCLDDIEEMIESSNLLQNNEIKDHFTLLLELKDELTDDTGENEAITESIIEDISTITRELTGMIDKYQFNGAKTVKRKLRDN